MDTFLPDSPSWVRSAVRSVVDTFEFSRVPIAEELLQKHFHDNLSVRSECMSLIKRIGLDEDVEEEYRPYLVTLLREYVFDETQEDITVNLVPNLSRDSIEFAIEKTLTASNYYSKFLEDNSLIFFSSDEDYRKFEQEIIETIVTIYNEEPNEIKVKFSYSQHPIKENLLDYVEAAMKSLLEAPPEVTNILQPLISWTLSNDLLDYRVLTWNNTETRGLYETIYTVLESNGVLKKLNPNLKVRGFEIVSPHSLKIISVSDLAVSNVFIYF